MAGIFISYRRSDCAGHAGRLYDRLVDHFGDDEVFMDVDAIAPGVDFGERIDGAISSCNLLVALIGKDWLDVTDLAGGRRLDDPTDLVRREIASALGRSDLLVIPVLVEGATMPRAEQLPDDLKPLTRRNAFELSDARWRYDVDRLIDVAQSVLPARAPAQPQGAEPGVRGGAGEGMGSGLPTDRVAGDAPAGAAGRNALGCLIVPVIALVIFGGGAFAIVKFIDYAVDGAATGPWRDRQIGSATKRSGPLTLSVVRVEQRGSSTRVSVVAQNNSEDTLRLPRHECRLRGSGVSIEADPFKGTWTDDLPTGGERQHGTIVFDGTLPVSATRASFSVATIHGSFDVENIRVPGIKLRRP